MKVASVIWIALLLAWNILAQDRKNEIMIGVNGAEHFDSSPYALNKTGFNPTLLLPTNVYYTRYLKKDRGIMLDYNYLHFWYNEEHLLGNASRLYYPGEVKERAYHVFRASYFWDVSKWKFLQLNFFIGPSLRIGHMDVVHTYYAEGAGGVGGGHNKTIFANGVGTGFGLRARVKVYKNFSLALDTRYAHYLVKSTCNEMLNSLLIGYSFGGKSAE